jgi:hypothetical protein
MLIGVEITPVMECEVGSLKLSEDKLLMIESGDALFSVDTRLL